jgi:hypothetical protein
MSSENALTVVDETEVAVTDQEEEIKQVQMRQSAIDITVVTPNGKKILVSSVNPAEPTSYIKQMLQEYQETASFTNYNFEVAGTVISDYVEIANYAPAEEETSSMTICLVPAQYDIKKSRLQLKRVREMIAYPPVAKGTLPFKAVEKEESKLNEENGIVAEEPGQETEKKEKTPKEEAITAKEEAVTAASLKAKLPKETEIFAAITLEEFFSQSMLRTGSVDPIASGSALKVRVK